MSAVQTVSPKEDASAERWRQWQVRNAYLIMKEDDVLAIQERSL